MKTSIATVSVGGTLDSKLEAIARAGYAAAEIFENDLLSSPLSAAAIGAMMRDLGLACAMLQPFRDYEGMPADQRDRALERMRRKFAVMDDLGTDLILLCSNCSPESGGDRQQLLDDLFLLGEGERLFDGVDMRTLGYECVQFVASQKATHVVLRRKGHIGA